MSEKSQETSRVGVSPAALACVAAALVVCSLLPLYVHSDTATISPTWHYTRRILQVATYVVIALVAQKRRCPKPWRLQLAGFGLMLAVALVQVCFGATSSAASGPLSLLTGCASGIGLAMAMVGTLAWLPLFPCRVVHAVAPGAMAATHLVFLLTMQCDAQQVQVIATVGSAVGAACAVPTARMLGGEFDSHLSSAHLVTPDGDGQRRTALADAAGTDRQTGSFLLMGLALFPFFYGLLAQLANPVTGLFDAGAEVFAVAALAAGAIVGYRRGETSQLGNILLLLVVLFATGFLFASLAWGWDIPSGWLVKVGFLVYSCTIWTWVATTFRDDPLRSFITFAYVEAALHASLLCGRALVSLVIGSGISHSTLVQQVVPLAIWVFAMVLFALLALERHRRAREERAEPAAASIAPSDDPAQTADEKRSDASFERACTMLGVAAGLTVRERQIVSAFARGRSAAYIAGDLDVSVQTVKTHLKHVYQKLDIHSRQDLLDLIEREQILAAERQNVSEA